MNVAAGIFLVLFGSVSTWWTSMNYPNANFTRAGSILMAISGIVFLAWTFTHAIAVGIGASALLLISGVIGVIGAFRKETRVLPRG